MLLSKYLMHIQERILIEIKNLKEISVDEINQIEPLLKKFGKETKQSSYFKYKDQPFEKWKSQFKKGKVKLLLAIDDSKTIGYIVGQIKEDGPNKNVTYIRALYLEPEYRSKGIANEMFNAIVEWGNDNNRPIIRLKTMGSNIGAIKFYKKMGMIPEIVMMRNKDSKNLMIK